MDRTRLLSPRQVARAIGVSESSVKRWCDEGLIETTRTAGGHRRLTLASVCDYLRREGHAPVEPALLAVPSMIGQTARIRRRSIPPLRIALRQGDVAVAAHLIKELLEAGHSLYRTLDETLFPALKNDAPAASGPPVTSSARIERRTRLTAIGVLDSLHLRPPQQRSKGRLAFVAALDGAPDSLWINGVAMTLEEAGWDSQVLGTLLPFRTLAEAIADHRPGLVCLQVPEVRNPDRFTGEWRKLARSARLKGTLLLAGNESLPDDLPFGLRSRFCIDFGSVHAAARHHGLSRR